jgi:DNA helicase-2/ATP-dependent DNA helicase PcrA
MPRPTSQQRAIIESELGPALVVAGAGSGKTETMANRVLWLLANEKVTANQVLGLTFTRKAAGELATRIRSRIGQLSAAGLVPSGYDDFDPPVVATYNSFANSIYRDNAILIGRESDGSVLGEASAWQLARNVVVSSSDPRLPSLRPRVDDLTQSVLQLSHALSENIVDPAEVEAFAYEFAGVAGLPPGGRGAYAEAETIAENVASLPAILELCAAYAAEKGRRGFVEYSDQVALALQIVRAVPRVRDELRNRFAVVLLDEYQDTSVVQTWLLAELFADHPVMAVGDPNQSIYGWRGASAENLASFAAQFDPRRTPGTTFALSTSWRNGHDVLTIANAIVEPLRAQSRVAVERLEPGPNASTIPAEVAFEETLGEEAESVARWLKARIEPSPGSEPPSAAILLRARKTQLVFIDALRRYGIPYHVLGVGGLMAEPEVADLVSALTVVNDPTAGAELVRLLAGSRWRLGVKDLHALSRLASWLRDRDYAGRLLDESVRATLRSSVTDGEGGSIIDAIDFIAHTKAGHSALDDFSEPGLLRLRDAGLTFSRLRARSGLDLKDFVTLVEQELLLDIEVVANDMRPTAGATMEAFHEALSGYLAVSETGGLAGFLGWLREAEWRDDLSPRPDDPEPGTVQLLTIHAAKGLEWDVVVVPRMVVDELPGRPLEGTNGWLRFGELPYEFRGDAAVLPEFRWRQATTRKELLDERDTFKSAVAEHQEREERRLAYVAVTRARHSLLMTGSFWATQVKPRTPSTYLGELALGGIIDPLPSAPQNDESPIPAEVETVNWPFDPLGGRRSRVELAAALVEGAVPEARGSYAREIDVLLEERRRALSPEQDSEVPIRVPASRFKDYVTDPIGVAASLRRPMPERPYRATRLGTLFHAWVEERYGVGGTSESIDALAPELDVPDLGVDEGEFARLKSTFERSPWASTRPIEVEREIHLPFDGRVIICKIDAVYAHDDRIQIVDWKTGKAPKDAEDLERKQLQLALYRLAYSRWSGIDSSLIDAAFYFVSDDRVIVPDHIDDEAELLARWRSAFPLPVAVP